MSDNGILILGLDPGSRVTGFGLVREVSGTATLVEAGTIRCNQEEEAARLGHIHRELSRIIERHAPVEAAVEDVFTAKNARSALKLGQARGAALAACALAGLPVSGYPPTHVKKSLVGQGRAEKEQVAFMVAQVLGVRKPEWAKDASDALAVAVCHLNERRMRRLTGAA